jgi:magnesium-transporting ATPase (P-type)
MVKLMQELSLLPAKAKVVLTNLLTWLTLLQTVLTFLVASGHLDSFPELLRYVLLAITGITMAITFIRRVTPVEPDGRGLLPK